MAGRNKPALEAGSNSAYSAVSASPVRAAVRIANSRQRRCAARLAQTLHERRHLPIGHRGEVAALPAACAPVQFTADRSGRIVEAQPIDHRRVEDRRQALIDSRTGLGHLAQDRHQFVQQVDRGDAVDRHVQQRRGHMLLDAVDPLPRVLESSRRFDVFLVIGARLLVRCCPGGSGAGKPYHRRRFATAWPAARTYQQIDVMH